MTSPDEAGGGGGGDIPQLNIVDPQRLELRHSHNRSLSGVGIPTPPIDIPKPSSSSRSPGDWSGLWSGSHEVGGKFLR